jgi:release factor glutamine methyltransferase
MIMTTEQPSRTKEAPGNSCFNEFELYDVYFGMGHSITLIDDPKAFKVSPAGVAFGSLLTRYVTEELLTARMLDLGTGSGIHSLLLKSIGVGNVVASDISEDAVAIARKNELLNYGNSTIEFCHGDLFEGLKASAYRYDVILFNPPGWRTPSNGFLEALGKLAGSKVCPVGSMFYGDEILARFFNELPFRLVDGGKVIIGLNSLVGIKQSINRLRHVHANDFIIQCRLLERHEFPLFFYYEEWTAAKHLFISEILSWTRQGLAYCSVEKNGQINWSYEIVELTLRKK